MASRRIPLVTEEIYHIFNRSIAKEPIFHKSADYQRFLEIIDFYRFNNPSLRFSFYNRLAITQRNDFLASLYHSNDKLLKIFSFSLMPNHFHFLAKQIQEDGIKKFVSQIENSYAKYFNTKYQRTGGLFQTMFKAVRIETDEQLMHVIRYIHLNPLTSFLLKTAEENEKYPWSSYTDYLDQRNLRFVDKELFKAYFQSTEKLRSFTNDQANYQRVLNQIKHLLLE